MQTIAIGAEATISKQDNKVVKTREKKSYRHPKLDKQLRQARTRREVKVLQKLANTGFSPKLITTDKESKIEMEYIDGQKLAECLEQQDLKSICNEIGKKIKAMHDMGIIHGDLTTSNILVKENSIYFIDFGLSSFSQKIEDKAVDLHVLEEALESKHHRVSKEAFAIIKKAYNNKDVLRRLGKVESRGRNKKK